MQILQKQKTCKKIGGQGIGLCRTERMFNNDRIGLFVDMIMAENGEQSQC